MSVKYFWLVLLMFVAAVSQAKNVDAYGIKIKVNGIKDTVCYLANYYGDKQYLKDTAVVDGKGNFTFTGTEKLPGGIYLVVLPGKRYFEIVIADAQFFTLETDTANYVKNMKVKGSNENIKFYEFLNYLGNKSTDVESLKAQIKKNKADSVALTQKLIAIDKEVIDFRKSFIKQNEGLFITKVFKASEEIEIPEPPILKNGRKDSTFQYYYYKAHYFDNIDFSDDRLIRTPIFHQKIEKYIKNMVAQIPDSLTKEKDFVIKKARASKELFKYCVWFYNYTYETSPMMGMDAIFVHMAEKYYLTKEVDWIDSTVRKKFQEKANIQKPLLLGKIAPNAYLSDSLGKLIPLYNIKAKYIIMIFWDPNCGHCQKEVPKLAEFHKKVRPKGVEVYSASIERDDKDWKKFVREKHLDSFINVWDKYTYTDFRKMWDVYSTPVIYILDENKKIIAKRLGVDQLEDFFFKGVKLE